jgi:hypothetical protein
VDVLFTKLRKNHIDLLRPVDENFIPLLFHGRTETQFTFRLLRRKDEFSSKLFTIRDHTLEYPHPPLKVFSRFRHM